MHKLTPSRTAATALVEQLVINGVKHVFCVPGESFLPVLDALRDSSITVTVCRHEGGAAMMAEAIGKVTGRPGVCLSRAARARPMLPQGFILPSRIRRR
jgi:acetolactate synthase-1/2/3 large subunit